MVMKIFWCLQMFNYSVIKHHNIMLSKWCCQTNVEPCSISPILLWKIKIIMFAGCFQNPNCYSVWVNIFSYDCLVGMIGILQWLWAKQYSSLIMLSVVEFARLAVYSQLCLHNSHIYSKIICSVVQFP